MATLHLRLSPTAYTHLRDAATTSGRSTSGQAAYYLQRALDGLPPDLIPSAERDLCAWAIAEGLPIGELVTRLLRRAVERHRAEIEKGSGGVRAITPPDPFSVAPPGTPAPNPGRPGVRGSREIDPRPAMPRPAPRA